MRSFEEILTDITNSLKLACVHFEIIGSMSKKRFKKVLSKYYGYFYFSENAHRIGLVMNLSHLYDSDDKVCLSSVTKIAFEQNLINEKTQKFQLNRVNRLKPIISRLMALRGGRYAHKGPKVSGKTANTRFILNDKEILRLLNTAKRIVNDLNYAYDRSTIAGFTHGAKQEFERLLTDLKRKNSG